MNETKIKNNQSKPKNKSKKIDQNPKRIQSPQKKETKKAVKKGVNKATIKRDDDSVLISEANTIKKTQNLSLKKSELKSQDSVITLSNVSIYFGKKTYYKNLNLSIRFGGFYLLLGENGAGKSTLLNVVCNQKTNYHGLITFNGSDIRNAKNKSEMIFFSTMLQFPLGINSLKYIKLYTSFYLNYTLPDEVIVDAFKEMKIDNIMKTNPNKISSGEKKKLILLFAKLTKPKVLILDEPEANLDPTARYYLYTELAKMNKEGMTIMVSSHLMQEIKDFVNGAILIKDRQIVWDGFINSPKHLLELYNNHILLNNSTKPIIKGVNNA